MVYLYDDGIHMPSPQCLRRRIFVYVMAIARMRHFFTRKPKKHKVVPGFTLEVELIAESNGVSRSYSTKAAYIPTNDGHRISRALAEKLGLAIDQDNGTTKACWKCKSSTTGYVCKGIFTVTSDLPWDIIFGDDDAQGLLRGFPTPFEAAKKHNFPQTFDFPKPCTSRTSSWKSAGKRLSRAFTINSKRDSNVAKFGSPTPATSASGPNRPLASGGLCGNEIPNDGQNPDSMPYENLLQQSVPISIKRPRSKSAASAAFLEAIRAESSDVLFPSSEPCKILPAPNPLITAPAPTSSELNYDSTRRDDGRKQRPGSPNLILATYDTLQHEAGNTQVAPGLEPHEALKPSFDSRRPSLVSEAISENEVRKSDLHADPRKSDELHGLQVIENTSSKAGQKPSRARRKGANDDTQNISTKLTNGTTTEKIPGAKYPEPEPNPASTVETSILRVVRQVRRHTKGSTSTKSHSPARNRPSSVGSIEGGVSPAAYVPPENQGNPDIFGPIQSPHTTEENIDDHEPSEYPRNHGQITSFTMKRFIDQDTEPPPLIKQPSPPRSISDHNPTKPKRLKKRHNLPQIRAVNSNTASGSRNAESKFASASDDYWTWDEAAKQYFHIESDTGSAYWYEDTELESDEERGEDSRERAPVVSSGPPRNCEQADSGCLF